MYCRTVCRRLKLRRTGSTRYAYIELCAEDTNYAELEAQDMQYVELCAEDTHYIELLA